MGSLENTRVSGESLPVQMIYLDIKTLSKGVKEHYSCGVILVLNIANSM